MKASVPARVVPWVAARRLPPGAPMPARSRGRRQSRDLRVNVQAGRGGAGLRRTPQGRGGCKDALRRVWLGGLLVLVVMLAVVLAKRHRHRAGGERHAVWLEMAVPVTPLKRSASIDGYQASYHRLLHRPSVHQGPSTLEARSWRSPPPLPSLQPLHYLLSNPSSSPH